MSSSSKNSQRKCSVEKGVFRNFQDLQENTCARVPFLIKLQASACNFIKTLTLNFTFGYCSGACAGLKITVYIFCWFLLHVTMTSWVKKFCSQNLLNLVSMEREFMQINFCYKTYSWFLFIFGLLAFKECITWSWYKGGICFSRKTYRTMYHS